MSRSMTPYTVEERLGTTSFSSLTSAQQDALHSLASELSATVRSLIAQGILTVENGRVIVKNSHQSSPES